MGGGQESISTKSHNRIQNVEGRGGGWGHPVALVGEMEESRRHTATLQRGEGGYGFGFDDSDEGRGECDA